MLHNNVNKVKKDEIKTGINTYMQVLISGDDAPNFIMRKFIIEEGGSMPKHTNTVEHEQFILKGKAEIQIGKKILVVEKNDFVYIPAGVEHRYKTLGVEPFEFLCLVPNKRDRITLAKNDEN